MTFSSKVEGKLHFCSMLAKGAFKCGNVIICIMQFCCSGFNHSCNTYVFGGNTHGLTNIIRFKVKAGACIKRLSKYI